MPGENIIGLENKCVANCLSYSSAKYQLRGKCEEGCDPLDTPESPALIRYSPTDYICKAKCGIDENIVKDGKECVSKSSCNNFRNALYTVSDPNDYVEYECIESCFNINVNGNSVDKFYYEKDKICIDRCNQGDKVVQDINRCITKCDDLIDTVYNLKYYLYQKIDGDADIPYDMCVLKCPEKKPYIDTDNSECVSKCPDTSRYYIQQFAHGEEDTRKKCLNDCPKEYPFYVIRESDGMKYYECIGTCDGFIVLNKDTNIRARRCLTNCPEENYKFKIINETENKKYCYEKCPDEMKYNIGGTTDDNNCYEICPEPSFYHKKDETECFSLSQLDNGIILYNKKEWRNDDSCPRNYLTTKVEDETITTKDIYICSNECLEEFGLYLTTYGTCVKDCESSSLVQGFNLKNDVNNSICVCQKLYYRDEISRKIVCNENIPGTCGDLNPDYPIPLFGTNECLKYCSSNRILNPDEDICYEPGTPCSRVRPNTLLLESQDKKKCDCEFKFYFENNGKKICLGENDVCPESRKKYYPYPDTMECANSCKSGYYTFKNYCLKQCPSGSTINDDTMTCDCGNKFWYQVSEGNYECLPADCLGDFPLSSEDKECLKTCRNTYYPIYFQDKCFDECEGGLDKFSMNGNSPLSKYAQYYCNCSRPWYNELISDNEYVMHCPKASDDIKECKFYENGLINMIEETRECKATCPEKYPYLFNELCFTSCEYADEKYAFHIQKVENSYVCGCQNLWHKNMTDFDKKICYEKTRDECPIDIDQDSYGSYLILTTKQCVDSGDECPPNFFRFNMICYDKCPEFTLEGKNEQNKNICKCDKSHLWLKYEKYGNTYYKCGLDACPETSIGDLYIRKILLESENQCVRSCTDEAPEGNEYLYSFRGKCVKDCPSLTKQVNDECQFYDIKSSGHVDDLDDLKEKANVQAKELYKEAGSYSGFIMHDFGASLQIYALNKIDSHRDLAIQSNLTYIDLGTCLDKIYADNNLEDTDNILVTKYDLLSRTHKSNNNDGNADGDAGEDATPSSGGTYTDNDYLINQVEYEFYLQRNNEKISGAICSPYEIEISYPIFYNKNKYDNYQMGKNYNNYLKQFLLGKDLHAKNEELDTFNKNNKVYRDLCLGIEINGKDLVLEDRYNYLYPNNVSLCESNCTMKNTDFDLQRINCMCTYKEMIDFKRIDEDINDILNDPDFKKPEQSSGNAQIIKCISKLGIKEGLIKNEAFYFCAGCSIVIVTMSLVSAFSGIKGVGNFMNGMLKMKGGNNLQNLKNNNSAVNSTNRLMNNPPKKGNENETEDNNVNEETNKKSNIVVKKNINLNYKVDSENLSEVSIYNDNTKRINIQYGGMNTNTKNGFGKNKKKSNYIDLQKKMSQYNTANGLVNRKAEFIPPQYNFKFFKPGDKGMIKKINRSEIPFVVDKDTKILLEGKKGYLYDENYLEGPFYEDQNILEIIEDDKKNNDFYSYNKNNIVIFDKKNYKNLKKNPNGKISIYDGSMLKKSISSNSSEKGFIKIKKINPIKSLDVGTEEFKDDEIKDVDNTTSIYNLMKREHTFLRVPYEKYMAKNHPNILATLLAEIVDKIYLMKVFIFLKKFEIFSVHLSLYMFYHVLVLSLICGFFTIKVIKKIWEEANYPTINFYLLYGLITHIIIWIIYRLFILVLDNQDKIRALVKQDNYVDKIKESMDETNLNKQKEIINEKYSDLMKKIKIQTAAFYLVVIVLTALCFIYLVSFFAIYTGTKSRVLKAYYISLIEIVLIKLVYGLILGSLRIAADSNELKKLYNFVYILDKYVS